MALSIDGAHPGSSSISIIFDHEFRRIIVGYSNDDRIFKFPCGKREPRDDEHAETIADAARRCALRELGAETDPSVPNKLLFFHKLSYERSFEKRIHDGSRVPLVQYHFVGAVKERIDFWSLPVENHEMGVPEWWTPFDVLRLDRIEETRDSAQHARTVVLKFNPYHQIALVRCLRELRQALGEHRAAMDGIFANLVRLPVRDDLAHAAGLKKPFTDLDDVEGVIRNLLRIRKI